MSYAKQHGAPCQKVFPVSLGVSLAHPNSLKSNTMRQKMPSSCIICSITRHYIEKKYNQGHDGQNADGIKVDRYPLKQIHNRLVPKNNFANIQMKIRLPTAERGYCSGLSERSEIKIQAKEANTHPSQKETKKNWGREIKPAVDGAFTHTTRTAVCHLNLSKCASLFSNLRKAGNIWRTLNYSLFTAKALSALNG